MAKSIRLHEKPGLLDDIDISLLERSGPLRFLLLKSRVETGISFTSVIVMTGPAAISGAERRASVRRPNKTVSIRH